MKLLFLDIDGVLNDHSTLPSGLCGIDPGAAAMLNYILDSCPDVEVVVSSAWRYYVHNGIITLQGFEMVLRTHGLKVNKRLHGITAPDAESFKAEDHEPPFDQEYWQARGLRWRAEQIRAYAQEHQPESFVVLDDLPLDMPELVCTADIEERPSGIAVVSRAILRPEHAFDVVRRFGGELL